MIAALKSFNIQSAAFWSALAGAVADVCAILNVGSAMTSDLRNVVVSVGTLLIAIPVHHVVKAQVAATTTPTILPLPPVVPPVA